MIKRGLPMRKLILLLAGLATACATAPAWAQSTVDGLWLNPHGTVAVRTGPCGDKLCGWIVWASPQARADARDSGVDKLDGLELLEDYRPDDDGGWEGTVYVPDMGHRFSSTITQPNAGSLRVKGCLIGGLFCKSQVWKRIESLPQ
jgi:uncharacterized protein (DUF2147 family)